MGESGIKKFQISEEDKMTLRTLRYRSVLRHEHSTCSLTFEWNPSFDVKMQVGIQIVLERDNQLNV